MRNYEEFSVNTSTSPNEHEHDFSRNPLPYINVDCRSAHNGCKTHLSTLMPNRNQFVSYEKNKCKMAFDKYGVPQGSILEPLVFLVYINHTNKASKWLNTIMFADASNLFFSHRDNSPQYFSYHYRLPVVYLTFCSKELVDYSHIRFKVQDELNKKQFFRANIAISSCKSYYFNKFFWIVRNQNVMHQFFVSNYSSLNLPLRSHLRIKKQLYQPGNLKVLFHTLE